MEKDEHISNYYFKFVGLICFLSILSLPSVTAVFVDNSTEGGGWNVSFTQTNLFNSNTELRLDYNLSKLGAIATGLTFDDWNASDIRNFNSSRTRVLGENVTKGVSGWRNQSIEMNATTTSWLNLPDTSIWNVGTGDFAFSGWFFVNTVDGTHRYGWDIARAADVTDRYSWGIRTGTSFWGTEVSIIAGTAAPATGRWIHRALIRETGTTTAYTECRVNKSVVVGNDYNLVDKVVIGSRNNQASNSFFGGKADDFVFLDHAVNCNMFTNGSYYDDGNVTTVKVDWLPGNGTGNVSYNTTDGALPAGTTVNIYQNYSSDDSTWNIELVRASALPETNYTPTNQVRFNHFILELKTTTNASPIITEIVATVELNISTFTLPNVISQEPANLTTFFQGGENINIEFNATTTNATSCTLHIWNGTGQHITFTRMDPVVELVNTSGSIQSGGVDSLLNDDGVYYIQREDGTAPNCMNTMFNFTGLELTHNFNIVSDGRFTPGGLEEIRWWWWNYTSNQKVSFRNETKSTIDIRFTSGTIVAADLVNINGNATVGYDHEPGVACKSGHRYYLDLLELTEVGHNTVNTTAGFCEIDVVLNTTQSPIFYFWEVTNANGSMNFTLGNYTIFINATTPTGLVIIHPLNITYTEVDHPPIRLNVLNEPELDSIWYSLNNAANVTIVEFTYSKYWPNTSLHDLDNGIYNLTVFINITNGNENFATVFFEVNNLGEINKTEIAEEVWLFANRTTLNWFDKVVGGDIMTNEILFFLTVAGICIFLGFKTPGKASIPLFGISGIIFAVLGLFIRDTTPFGLFTREVGVTDVGLLNLMAMYAFFFLSVAMFIYPVYLYTLQKRDS